MSSFSELIGDRIRVNSVLIVACFVSVLLLESQSAASYPTYLLALSMLLTVRQWDDVFSVPIVWIMIGLLAYLCLSALWSIPFEFRDLVTVCSRALLVSLFVIAFAECQLRGALRRWLERAMAVVGLVAVLAAIVVFHATDPADGRLNGLGQLDTHVIAALVFGVVLILLLDAAFTDQVQYWRVAAVASIPFVGYAIFMSDSRNAWFATLTGVGVFVLARLVKDRQRFIAGIASLLVVLAVLVASLVVGDDTRELILPRGYSFRPTIWSMVISRMAEGNLLLGLGINTPNDVYVNGLEFLHPHNLYLAVAFQGGLVALTAMGVLIGAVLRGLYKHYESDDAKLALGILALSLPAYLLDGHELIDKVGSTWFLFWLPVGVGLGFSWRARLTGP